MLVVCTPSPFKSSISGVAAIVSEKAADVDLTVAPLMSLAVYEYVADAKAVGSVNVQSVLPTAMVAVPTFVVPR